MSDDIAAIKARLYAALKHEKSCICGECSGGLNAVDDLCARLADAERDEASWKEQYRYWASRAEAAEARANTLEEALRQIQSGEWEREEHNLWRFIDSALAAGRKDSKT